MLLENVDRKDINLQVSHLKNIEGMFTSEIPFLLNNISGEDLVVSINPASEDPDYYIETVIQPGWSPIICCGIMAVEPGTIQIGY